MTLRNIAPLALALATALLISSGTANAAILDPITDLVTEIVGDLQGMVTVLGALALIVGLIMMLFGQGNAWKLAVVGVVIVIMANAQDIVSSMVS